jgi:hypothetical protein
MITKHDHNIKAGYLISIVSKTFFLKRKPSTIQFCFKKNSIFCNAILLNNKLIKKVPHNWCIFFLVQ